MTQFNDMPSGTRAQWLAWANSHDWGGARARWASDGKSMVVECAAVTAEGEWIVEEFNASDPGQLRGWAGY